ncbi:hypothetical protein KUTeg_005890 [Tegillarca granosa]|uniref:Uncharacterized protein n=1 Tax=Tegillarca granosa TaxID=220873 RepID=A0ABQ9FGT8_TEGGR|nr:hypothetical protein KUTeg_005890 [Tegillarca granosa]
MISSALNVNRNGIVMSRFENSYSGDNNVAKTSHILQANNKEISLKSITQYGTYPLTTDIDLQWSPNEKIQVVGSLDKTPDDLINGYWKFSSSFTDDKMLSLTQNMDGEDTLSTATIQYHPDRAISMKSRYKWDNTKKIYFTLNTPYQSLRVLQTEIEFTGNSQRFALLEVWKCSHHSENYLSVHTGAQLGEFREMYALTPSFHNFHIKILTVETVGRLEPYDIEGLIKITTPFSEMPYTAANFRHQGGLNRFQTHGDYECPTSGKYDLINQNNKEGSIVVKLPSRDNISARFSHSGDLSNFQSHCELSHEVGRLYQADIKFVNAKRKEGTFTLKSPFADNIIGLFRHSGDLNNFQSHTEFQFARKRK